MRPDQLSPVKILLILLVVFTLLFTPSLVAISSNPSTVSPQTALSTTIATGTLSVLWGDPYSDARINQGTGNVTLTVNGAITPRNDLPGYYTYKYPSDIDGDLEAQWTASNESYFLDVYLYQGYSEYNRTTVYPAADTFAAMYVYFWGTLSVNGVTSQIRGLAAAVAAAPDFFSFHGTARATYVILYPQTYHGNSYVFRWSQTDQNISGIEQPRADSLTQTVQLT